MDTQEKPSYLTPNEVARALRVDATTVRRWIRERSLAAETVKEGRRIRHRIPRAALEALQQTEST